MEHLGLITTTGNTSDKGLNEFLLELENEALRLFTVVGQNEQLDTVEKRNIFNDGYSLGLKTGKRQLENCV